MIRLSFLAFSLLFSAIACVSTEQRESTAERNADHWAQDMGIPVSGVACVGWDSEADGYVSCTISTIEGEMIPIECGYDQAMVFYGQNTGCKEKRVMTIAGQGDLSG